jgi:biopolymer transport protein ExbD
MPKIKKAARSPHIDMTPMVDLFSLLLTFFILTATFRPSDPAQLTTPNSNSDKEIPDHDVFTIFIAPDANDIEKGVVFIDLDNGKDTTTRFRSDMLEQMAFRYEMTFTPEEYTIFSRKSNFGMPMDMIRGWINAENMQEADKFQVGIPMDSIDNQFAWWVYSARVVNPGAEIAIKADGDVPFPMIKKVLDVVQAEGVNRFNLITTLERQTLTVDDIPN